MSETSSLDVDGEEQGSSDHCSAHLDPSEAIQALRLRSQRLALRLQLTHREMESSAAAACCREAPTSHQLTKVYMLRRPVEMVPGPSASAMAAPNPTPVSNRQALPNAGSIPIPIPMPMTLPYPLPMPSFHAVPMQMAPQLPGSHPPQVQFLQNMQQGQSSMQNVVLNTPRTSQRKKSKKALREEVDALMEMVQKLSMVWSPDVNAYASQIIRQNEVLSQLEWTHPADNLRAKMAQMPHAALRQLPQRIDGGSEMGRRQIAQQRTRGPPAPASRV